jgi:hypothetical protein
VRCCGQDVCKVGNYCSARVAGGNSGSPTLAGATQVLFLSTSMNMIVQNRISLCLASLHEGSYLCPTIRFRRRWKREGANSIYYSRGALQGILSLVHISTFNFSSYIIILLSCSSRGQNFLHQSHFHKINQNYNHALTPQLHMFKLLCV